MATKVKPCRIKATGTPQVWYVPKYVDEDTFQWWAWWGGWWSDIVYATQAEYNALLPWAASDWKHYFIYSTDGGWGWQPWVNTIAYYPLDTTNTVNDLSGNNYSLTWEWTYNFGTYWWVDCCYVNVGMLYSAISSVSMSWGITVNVWYNEVGTPNFDNGAIAQFNGNDPSWNEYTFTNWIIRSNGRPTGEYWITGYLSNLWIYSSTAAYTVTTSTWYNLCYTYTWSTGTLYINGSLAGSLSLVDWTDNKGYIQISRKSNLDRSIKGYLSEAIFENKARTAQEIADYYNNTKANYWIS